MAQAATGPRAIGMSPDTVDAEGNLILLCRVDHKRVDDQPNYFTAERLRAIKLAHESWVHTALSTEPPNALRVRIRRQDSRPTSLQLITSGASLLALVLGAEAYDFDNDDLQDRAEMELVSSFLQLLHDYGEMGDDLESGARVEARFELGQALNELTNARLLVYGAEIRHVIEGGVAPPAPWRITNIRVKRLDNVLRDVELTADQESASVTHPLDMAT
ncbi:MAG: hypothetical protein M3Z54_01595 [Gemmatimonadota bacterium]|nr:hypothetical protein [Gemmatimonadota bacterium]